jgi:oxygen-independent coproporphyrinogen III oxidase
MPVLPPFDAELVRRHERAGPRYTSYPPAPHFHAGFGAADYREAARLSNQDPIPRALSLYVHVPFCLSPCFYCGCNRIITRDLSKGERYLDYVRRECEQVAPLFDRDREVLQLHLGGGTPNFLSPDLIEQLLADLGQGFRLASRADRDYSIEIDPRSVDAAGVRRLAALGFNRASLGVQDFDPAVQQAVNRLQGVEPTLEVMQALRDSGFRSINIDLIYGLPRQTREGFSRTLDTVIAARPQRMAIYAYAHMPNLFRAQRQIRSEDLPSPEHKLALLALAVDRLSEAGYEYIGLDHFALPEDSLARAQRERRLQRNFMGYTTHADTDLIGLGMSSISRIGRCFAQNARELGTYQAALDAGQQPIVRGLELDEDDQLRAELIQQLMCHDRIDIRQLESEHGIVFEEYFSDARLRLAPMLEDGLVEWDASEVRVTLRGRLLLRAIAMCFDRRLHQASAPAPYPRAV